MPAADLVRSSRDGDQFHYVWAARQCLSLLPGQGDLVAVTIEGASTGEVVATPIEPGEELIDVGLYYGAEAIEKARAVRYVQLKHSTVRTDEPWTASGLENTIKGFASRYAQLVERTSSADVARRFGFQFTTNRPINDRVAQALSDLATNAPARHPSLREQLLGYAGLDETAAHGFFRLLSVVGEEDGLWAQRNLLAEDIRAYLPEADYDGPVQLKDLVARKASSEFKGDPSIRRYDVLHSLKAGEDDLFPAPNMIQGAADTFPREQEPAILAAIVGASNPVILHADGGVGKSMLATRIAHAMPTGSQAVIYDCFGDGLYRSAHNWRHRHRDAFTQIANELASRGLCHPLIPAHADVKAYVRAFTHRLAQAATVLTSDNPSAVLCLVIDAADNAEMAARDQNEASSFVRDLIRMPLHSAVRLVLTCRTHRRSYLDAPPGTPEIPLSVFTIGETAVHLRRRYPLATDAEVAEFAHLSSDNPRVQAMAMSLGRPLSEMLQALGPNPTTIDAAIGGLLSDAVAKLRDRDGGVDAKQIDHICQGLAVLRPLIPIPVLERLTGVNAGAIRSFAFDLGRPLLVRGETLHFMDEPAETWFRETFTPATDDFDAFIQRLRPLAATSAYVAAALPQLLLEAGHHEELVALALSSDALPTDNPLERRDVELQRLTFALKASLHRKAHLDAAKLALKAAGETAGEGRQNDLLRSNVHLAAQLLAPDRVLDLASRRMFGTEWMGSHHAYSAVLLSGRPEFKAAAASHLRMAMDWLLAWARHQAEIAEDHFEKRPEMTDEDRAALALAHLRVDSAKAAAGFLRRWRHRPISFSAGCLLAKQLVDLGDYGALSDLARGARNNVWLLLALAVTAQSAGQSLPAASLKRLLRLLADRRIQLDEPEQWNDKRDMLGAVTAAVDLALTILPPEPAKWAALIRRYLPDRPPTSFSSDLPYDRSGLLKAYVLEAALRDEDLALTKIAPEDVRRELEREPRPHSFSRDAEIFLRETGGLLPWIKLWAETRLGRSPPDLVTAISTAAAESTSAERRGHTEGRQLRNAVAQLWLALLAENGVTSPGCYTAFNDWRRESSRAGLWPDTLISLCRRAARTEGLADLGFELASEVHGLLAVSREEAQTRTEAYLQLARAVFPISKAESNAYLDEAVAIASRIGEENLDRWAAFLNLAGAAASPGKPRARTTYRLSRMAELTYEYVIRDKHFPWNETARVLAKLCPSSALAILARWRDRRFGDPGRLLPEVIGVYLDEGHLPPEAPIVLSGLDAEWSRAADLERFLSVETDPSRRRAGAEIAYRYLRLGAKEGAAWERLGAIFAAEGWSHLDVQRINTALLAMREAAAAAAVEVPSPTRPMVKGGRRSKRPEMDEPPQPLRPVWPEIFAGIDVTTADGLTNAYGRLRACGPPIENETFWKEAAARVPTGREAEFMQAFADRPDASIFTLRHALDHFPPAWRNRLTFRRALCSAILSACRKQPEHVYRRGWARIIPFDELFAEGLVTDDAVVEAMLEGFTEALDTLNAGKLFRLLDPLAARLTPDEADQALNHGLDLMEPNLKAEDGDGPWAAALEPPSSIVDALAGYVWTALASPVAADRWASAHVIRSAVEFHWRPFLTALADHATSGRPGPFADAGLVFYAWHANQWLALGLARGALAAPAALEVFVPWLRTMISQPHVIVADLARQALLAWASIQASAETTRLTDVNRPRLAETVYDQWRADAEDVAAVQELKDEDRYYFGYDFGDYWLSPLGRAFGLTKTSVERRALRAVREDFGWSGKSWEDDARHQRKIFGDGETYMSRSSLPKVDSLSAYHGYHAIMVTAGRLLTEASVGRKEGEAQTDFDEWMERHWLTRRDGRWLFDRADAALVRSPPGAETYDAAFPWRVDPAHLDAQLTTPDGRAVLWGEWTAGHDDRKETVTVRSALVSEDGASALLAAFQTMADPSRYRLPAADRDEDVEIDQARLTGWVADENIEHGLDEYDSWAEGLRFPAAGPGSETRQRLSLQGDLDGRVWRGAPGVGLLSESWTTHHGYGREAETHANWRLSADPGFVPALIEAFPGDCLILSVKIRRQPPRHSRDEFESYPWPYNRYYLMRSDGVPSPL